MLNIVITGSDGFIGNNLKKELSKYFNVIPMNRKTGYDMSKPVKIDLKNKIDFFIHAAFQVKLDNLNISEYKNINYKGVINSLNFCRTNNIKYIFLSSYVYGPPKYLPIDIHHPTNPHNEYLKMKLKCEKLCKQFSEKYNMSSIILRLFNIYGKKQRAGYIFSDIINQIENSKIYVQNMNSKRDFLHVDDLTSLIRKIIIKNFNECKIFNVGSGKSTSVNEIAEVFVKIKSSLRFLLAQAESQEQMDKERWIKSNLVKDCFANIKDLEDIYDWQPKISIEEGIKKLLNNE